MHRSGGQHLGGGYRDRGEKPAESEEEGGDLELELVCWIEKLTLLAVFFFFFFFFFPLRVEGSSAALDSRSHSISATFELVSRLISALGVACCRPRTR